MGRLIDADDLIKPIEESYKNSGLHGEDLRKIRRWIRKAPTVDAEPVIRCCDCKHSWESLIPESVTCEEMQRTVYAQGYCYRGERKQDGDTE